MCKNLCNKKSKKLCYTSSKKSVIYSYWENVVELIKESGMEKTFIKTFFSYFESITKTHTN